jgi:hypothetical protein
MIIGFAFPLAIRLSRMKWARPCLSRQPHLAGRALEGIAREGRQHTQTAAE